MSENQNYWGPVFKQVQLGIIAILTILGLIFSDWLYRDTQNKLFSELWQSASVLNQYFKQSFYHRELTLTSIGYRLLEINGPNKDSMRLGLARRYLKYNAEITAIGLADTTGLLTTFTGQKVGVENPNLSKSPKSKRSFLLAKESTSMTFGEAYYFDEIDDWMVPIRVPIRDKDGNLLALNTSAIDYKRTIERIKGFELNPDFNVHLVNTDFNTTLLYFPLDSSSYSQWLGKDAAIYTDTLYNKNKGGFFRFKAKNLKSNVNVLGVKIDEGLFNQLLVVTVNSPVLVDRFLGRVQFVIGVYLGLVFLVLFAFRYFKKKEFRHTRALLKERKYSGDIIHGSPSLIIGIDSEGICSLVNPAALETIQYKEKEIIGHNWWKILYPDDYYSQVNDLFDNMKGQEVRDYEMTLVRKDSVERIISWNSISFYDSNGTLKNVVGFGRDVTELKQAQLELKDYTENLEEQVKERTEELTESNQVVLASNYKLKQQHQVLKDTLESLEKTQSQLFQADKMASLGVLLAGVGHEINNPLNFINGGVQGLKNLEMQSDEVNDQTKPFYDIIDEGVKRAVNIVKSLSHFSRKTGKMDEECDVHLIINNCLTILHNQIKQRVEIEKIFSSNNIVIHGSEGKLHQAILNVLSNAEQSIVEQGKITISTSCVDDFVHISIKDTGVGIEKNNLAKIGDPFFTTKEVGEGTGLGLSITYSIMEEHNGKINVNSKIGEGTEFILILPL